MDKSNGRLRSCVQDAIINGARQLGVDLCSTTLKKECKPLKTKNTALEEVLELDMVRKKLEFVVRSDLGTMEGGPIFNTFLQQDAGVFLLLCTLTSEGKSEDHALIYDSHFTDSKHPHCKGAIICNRKNNGVRLLEPSDRVSKNSAKKMLISFYGASVRVTHIGQLIKVESTVTPS